MSATMTMTMAQPATLQMSTQPCCPKCGYSVALSSIQDAPAAALLDAQKQIEDLQAQVRLLNQKATAAVDRWADYEDELSKLRRQVSQQQQQQQQRKPEPPPSPNRTSFLSTAASSRISALLSPRSAKSMSNLRAAPSPSTAPPMPPTPGTPAFNRDSPAMYSQQGVASPTPSTDDLLEALSREQRLRLAAEGRLNDTSREVEELSVQLFEQANEMVATERRARAKLEERVEVLEKRDVEKRQRLDRLESAMGRIERVRTLLGTTAGSGGGSGQPSPKEKASENLDYGDEG